MEEALGRFHPQIVHTPIALIVFSALFMLVGRLTDSGWWRKAAVALLIFGFLGAVAGFFSGREAEEGIEDQGVPEAAVESHEAAAIATLWLAGGALVVLAAASRVKAAAGPLAVISLLLQVMAAVTVGIAGHRGGKLVFEYGAHVQVRAPADSGAAVEPHEHRGTETEHRH